MRKQINYYKLGLIIGLLPTIIILILLIVFQITALVFDYYVDHIHPSVLFVCTILSAPLVVIGLILTVVATIRKKVGKPRKPLSGILLLLLSLPALIVILILNVKISDRAYAKRDFELTDKQRKLLEVYKAGDILYFASSTGCIDTILVLGHDTVQKTEVGYFLGAQAFNTIGVQIMYMDYSRSPIYNQDYKKDTVYREIISITKYPQRKKTSYYLQFKGFSQFLDDSLGILHTDTVQANGLSFTNYYLFEEFSDEYSGHAADYPIKVYWAEEKGLIAYKQADGTFWVRLN